MQGLIDSTLREGAQSVGVSFSKHDKISIFTMLAEIGIEEIELGIASANSESLADLFESCRPRQKKSRMAVWCRCNEEDVATAAQLQPDVLSLSIPASDLHLQQKLGRDREWAVANLCRAIQKARNMGLDYISVGLEDAGRADPGFLRRLARTVYRSGGQRIRIADTVGTCCPKKIQEMITGLRLITPLAIGIHAHNDFGMATANTITALTAGADWGDVSALGLGERAGMARLEEVAGFLALQRHRPGYRIDLLKALCQTISRAANRQIEPHHPVIGEEIFACETGLHLQGLLRDPNTYEPFDPQLVGSRRKLLFGTKVGKNAVLKLLADHHQSAPATAIEKLTASIRQRARLAQRPLTAGEIISTTP